MSSGRSTTSSSSSRGTSSTARSHPRWATSSIVISCRVLDLVFVTKDADGAIEGFELGDIDEGIAGEIEKLEIDIAHVLSEDDVVVARRGNGTRQFRRAARLGEQVGRTVRVGGASLRRSAGRERPDPHTSADRRARGRKRRSLTCRLQPVVSARRGVVGAPVARTAAVVGTAAVVAHGVNRRSDRREDRRDRR